MKKHERLRTQKVSHTLHANCDKEGCCVCEGGLAWCVTCGGAEASLPTECPGFMMTAGEQDLVQNGELDFKDGQWRRKHPDGGEVVWRPRSR